MLLEFLDELEATHVEATEQSETAGFSFDEKVTLLPNRVSYIG